MLGEEMGENKGMRWGTSSLASASASGRGRYSGEVSRELDVWRRLHIVRRRQRASSNRRGRCRILGSPNRRSFLSSSSSYLRVIVVMIRNRSPR